VQQEQIPQRNTSSINDTVLGSVVDI
jgi:hypothetical protein